MYTNQILVHTFSHGPFIPLCLKRSTHILFYSFTFLVVALATTMCLNSLVDEGITLNNQATAQPKEQLCLVHVQWIKA